MTGEGLTGSRIRERRQIAKLRQADLAKQIGISASYLNLIEHNRRRIGGKLLLRIANVLDVEPSTLSEGAEATLISALREAEAALDTGHVELDRIEEFAGRFPGWAALLAAAQRRLVQMDHAVEALNDQLAHDPALAASVHEVLSTAASIRSTASILAETDSLEKDWLNRFHANINEDSARLAESSRTLARYLEQGQDRPAGAMMPQEEADSFLERHRYHFPDLEADPSSEAVVRIVEGAGLSKPASMIVAGILHGYASDVTALPADDLRAAIGSGAAVDPLALAERFGVGVPLVLRRIACLPDLPSGYVLADRSGSLLLRKAVPGLSLPRFGATCPLWPLFQALAQPGVVIRKEVVQLGRVPVRFDCIAVAEATEGPSYNDAPLARAGMLVLPSRRTGAADIELGPTCRICPRMPCSARREPSVLTEG